ncbi:hypothetical protein [Oceanobacillus indicireducens]|uniref:Cytochrome c oxidase subunit 4 n=1 Tax=Oceanobacillus indicireducens TaxID=1004261 RepID=A0A917Y0T4_9BACI|nr:hypothetical protein [Oceanobacillus indicireducens]GGN61312.1 hypothetical protein GCM10007971_26270 [Oceanobacillus indicireducens]
MIGLLNVGSLVLGLIAWILPVISLLKYRSTNNTNWITLSILSLSACAVSLGFQMFYNYHLVKIEDWAALMDTAGAVAFAATVLLIVTILLNAITLFVFRYKSAK